MKSTAFSLDKANTHKHSAPVAVRSSPSSGEFKNQYFITHALDFTISFHSQLVAKVSRDYVTDSSFLLRMADEIFLQAINTGGKTINDGGHLVCPDRFRLLSHAKMFILGKCQ